MEEQRIQFIIEAQNRAQSALRNLQQNIQAAQRAVNQFNQQVQQGATRAGNAFKGMVTAAAPAASAINRLGQNFKGLGGQIGGLGNPLRFISGLFSALSPILGAIGNIGRAVFGAIGGLISRLIGIVSGLVSAIGGALWGAVQRVFGFLGTTAKIAVLSLGAALAALAKRGLDVNISLVALQNSFTVMLRNGTKAKNLLAELREEAKSSAGSFLDLGKDAKTLVAFGFDTSQIKGILRTLGDAATGLATDESPTVLRSQLAVIFGKIKTEGKMRGREVMQLGEHGINARAMLGLNEGADMESMEIPASVALPKLMQGMKDKFGGLQQNALATIPGKIANIGDDIDAISAKVTEGLHDRINKALGNILDFLDRVQNTKEGQAILNSLTTIFNALGDAIVYLSNILPNAVMWLGEFINSGKAVEGIANVWGWIRAVIDEIGKFVNLFTGGKGPLEVWDWFKEKVVGAIDWALRMWNAFTAEVEFFRANSKTIFAMIQEGIKGITNNVNELIGAAETLTEILLSWRLVVPLVGVLGRFLGGGGAVAAAGAAGGAAATGGGAAVSGGGLAAGLVGLWNAIPKGAGIAALAGTALKGFMPNNANPWGQWGIGGALATVAQGAGTGAVLGGAAGTVVPVLGNGVGALAGGAVGGGTALAKWWHDRNQIQKAGGMDNRVPLEEWVRGSNREKGQKTREFATKTAKDAFDSINNNPFFKDAKKVWKDAYKEGGLDHFKQWVNQDMGPNQRKYAAQAMGFLGQFGQTPAPVDPLGGNAPGMILGEQPRNRTSVTVLPQGMSAGTGDTYYPDAIQAPMAGVLPNLKSLDAQVDYVMQRLKNNPQFADALKAREVIPALQAQIQALSMAQPYESDESKYKRLTDLEQAQAKLKEVTAPTNQLGGLDAKIKYLQEQLQTDPSLSNSIGRNALLPALSQKINMLSQPVAGEDEEARYKRLAEVENTKQQYQDFVSGKRNGRGGGAVSNGITTVDGGVMFLNDGGGAGIIPGGMSVPGVPGGIASKSMNGQQMLTITINLSDPKSIGQQVQNAFDRLMQGAHAGGGGF